MSDTAVTEIEQAAENAAGKFLSQLIEHGEKLVAADIPADARKVLGALIHWTGNGGKFTEPDVFNPALSQEVAQAEAQASRLASENADLNKRLAALETLFAQGQVAPAPVPPSPVPVASQPSEGAAPVAPAPAPPVPVVPVVTAPPEAAPAAPTPPPSA